MHSRSAAILPGRGEGLQIFAIARLDAGLRPTTNSSLYLAAIPSAQLFPEASRHGIFNQNSDGVTSQRSGSCAVYFLASKAAGNTSGSALAVPHQ